MNHKPLAIVLGEPQSTFQEIILKSLKNKKISKFKRPLLFIGSVDLFKKQKLNLNYSFKINIIKLNELKKIKKNKNIINFIDIDFKYKKIFDKISSKSNNYINESFSVALKLLKERKVFGLINGPISKTHFLEKKYLGITEYLAKKTKSKKNPTMLIYNSSFSVCPITTHVPINRVKKNLSIEKIVRDVTNINFFYKEKLKRKPKFAILGLNPHCESIEKFSQEDILIIPAIEILLENKINIKGPFSADTFFSKQNLIDYDVCVGMYHDQVLTPMKTIFNFDAINLTLGLPFLRVSPDHGINSPMIGKNKSNPQSLISSIKFFKKVK